MKKTAFLLAIILLTLFAIPSQAALYVNVVTDEFSVESPYPISTVKACECGTRTEIIEVTNVGDFENLFSVQVFSPIIEYITLSEQSFVLKPGERKQVFLYIKAPCDTSISSSYVIRVATNYGRSKELYKEFESKKCQNLMFNSTMQNSTVYPGQTAIMQIDLQNVGDYQDNFRITPLNNHPYAIMSRDVVTLNPGEKTRVLMYITFPVDVYGKINQAYAVETEKGRNSGSKSHTYEILHDYDFSLKTEENDIYVCEELDTLEPIIISNLGRAANQYSVELRGPEFVSLEQNSATLEGRKNTSVELKISPRDTDVGEYELAIQAKTTYGNVVKQKPIRLFVNNCFASEASINGAADAIVEKSCCGTKEYTLNVVNRGMYEEAYSINVDSEGWVEVEAQDSFIRLNPGQQINIPVKAELPCADERRSSYVTVKQLRAPFETHEIKLDLESLSQQNCYNVNLVQQSYDINYQTSTIPLLVQNTGLKGGNYTVKLSEAEAKLVTLQEKTIHLMPGDLQVVHAIPANYSSYKEGRYLKQLTLNITPENEDIVYERQFWVNLKDKGFLAKAWEWLKGLNYSAIGVCGIISLILLLIVIAGALTAAGMRKESYKIKRIKASSIKKLRAFNIVLIALMLAIVLLLIFFRPDVDARLYEESTNKTSPLYHEWKQNSAYTIELSSYFTDPDTDELAYTSTQPNHIRVRIDGSFVRLTPEHNWGGEETIVFTAKDAKGGEAQSEVMTLHVIKKKPLTLFDYWSIYCVQVNLLLFLAIILVILFINDIVEEKAYRKYLSNKNKQR